MRRMKKARQYLLGIFAALLLCGIFYAGNEPRSVLARDLGDCRDNLRNSRSVFLIVADFPAAFGT